MKSCKRKLAVLWQQVVALTKNLAAHEEVGGDTYDSHERISEYEV